MGPTISEIDRNKYVYVPSIFSHAGSATDTPSLFCIHDLKSASCFKPILAITECLLNRSRKLH